MSGEFHLTVLTKNDNEKTPRRTLSLKNRYIGRLSASFVIEKHNEYVPSSPSLGVIYD